MRISDWSSDVCSSDLDAHDDFGQPVIKILTKARRADHRFQILMGSAYDARIDGNSLPPANSFNHSLLQEPPQLDLKRQRNVAHFVQKQGAPIGDRKSTRLNSSH